MSASASSATCRFDGRDGRHRLADEAHRVVERVAALLRDLLDLVVVLLAAGDRAGAPDDRAVLVREDRLDARQRPRLRRRRWPDARVRMRAAQHARVEHARQLNVARVGGAAGDALDGVDARRRMADGLERRQAGRTPVARRSAGSLRTSRPAALGSGRARCGRRRPRRPLRRSGCSSRSGRGCRPAPRAPPAAWDAGCARAAPWRSSADPTCRSRTAARRARRTPAAADAARRFAPALRRSSPTGRRPTPRAGCRSRPACRRAAPCRRRTRRGRSRSWCR